MEEWIRDQALQLGFSFCGIARYESMESLRPLYSTFVERQNHPGLEYLSTYIEPRLNPELLLKGTKSVIAFMMNYYPREVITGEDNFTIAKYAYGRDYHTLMRKRLKVFTERLHHITGNIESKAFVDSGPVLEKAWAQRCGIGWQGKNTLVINKSAGSFFFIGIVLTNLELQPDKPETDHCGNCRLCVTACPTGALNTPYQLDIKRCISFHTIENKAEIPGDIRDKLNDRIYGCDICQDTCPYNRFAIAHEIPEFAPSEILLKLRKKEWEALTEVDFDRIFSGSPVKRIGYQKLMQNIRAAAGQ